MVIKKRERCSRKIGNIVPVTDFGITKFSIAHDVLEKLNVKKENYLRELHELVRRVGEFEDFSTCRPTDRLRAMGLVADVCRVADVKGAFTRMCIDTEMEAKKTRVEAERKIQGATPGEPGTNTTFPVSLQAS